MSGLSIVFLGLSVTSSWGNGHATTYRALVKGLARRGHRVLFLERDVPWYATHRDLAEPPYGTTRLYGSIGELRSRFAAAVAQADLVVLGSYVPEGIEVGRWVLDSAGGATAFYDIDTPVTLAQLCRGGCPYVSPGLIPRFDLYLSFTGGPLLERLADEFGALRPRPLYCSVDPDVHRPQATGTLWDLGYMGTYSPDRQRGLEAFLLAPARALPDKAFAVAGPQYPPDIAWPANVERFEHLPPSRHSAFYGAQRFTLNLTRADMVSAGWSPSVRLFEAAAIGTPIVSDAWPGLEAFFVPGQEILIADSPQRVTQMVADLPETERGVIAAAARRRVLRSHTLVQRAMELEGYLKEVRAGSWQSLPRADLAATEAAE
ncbi:MAG TPA: glycosyltransferase [Geminicoccaceae bacterium]|nr:glycosyltransferase [Geminicoccaceae bacterium]